MPNAESSETTVSYFNGKSFAAVIAVGMLGPIRNYWQGHSALPEFLDVFKYAANISLSAYMGCAAGYVVGTAVAARADKNDEPVNQRTLRAKVAAGGLALGLIINGMAETKWGISLMYRPELETPEPLALMYGTMTATAAAVLLYTIKERSEGPNAAEAVEPQG